MVRETLFTTALVAVLATPALAFAHPSPAGHAQATDDDGDGDEPDDNEEPAVPGAASVAPRPTEAHAAVASPPDATAATAVAEENDDDDDDDGAEPPKLTFEWNGRIQSDLRFRPWERPAIRAFHKKYGRN